MLARSLKLCTLLAALAVLLITLEFKTAGVGLFVGAAVCAALILPVLLTTKLSSRFTLGSGLILSELASAGVPAFTNSGGLTGRGLIFSQPNGIEFDFNNENYGEALAVEQRTHLWRSL